jgi:hypothetical protein
VARCRSADVPVALFMLAALLGLPAPAGATSLKLDPPPPLPLPASLYSLSETNRTFAVGTASTPLTGQTAARHPRGTVFSFSLDKSATVTVSIQRRGAGRRVRGQCRAATLRLKREPKCARFAILRTLTRIARAGANTIPFSARFDGRALPPGSYRAIFTATDSAGVANAPQTLRFTIVTR